MAKREKLICNGVVIELSAGPMWIYGAGKVLQTYYKLRQGICYTPATSNPFMWLPLGKGCNFGQVSAFNHRELSESYQQPTFLVAGEMRVLVW